MKRYAFSRKLDEWVKLDGSGEEFKILESSKNKGKLLFNERQRLEKIILTEEQEEAILTWYKNRKAS